MNHSKKNQILYRFFIVGSSHHHLYYLIPYIETTKDKLCFMINGNTKYIEIVKKEFPNINFITFSYDSEELINYLNQASFLLHSNAYVLFEEKIRPKINRKVVIGFINHGVQGKFTDRGYISTNFMWDITVYNGRKDLDIFYTVMKIPKDKRLYSRSLFLKTPNGSEIQVILSGNIRVQHYMKNKPDTSKIIERFASFDLTKKIILYMPTFSYDPARKNPTYSSIPFFIKMLKLGVLPEDYNYILKLHPNIIYEKELLDELLLSLKKSRIRYYLDVLGGDYLPYMDISDLLITDRTSAFYDYLYFDKPSIFLDHNDECPQRISFNDVTNTYWSYQCGDVISVRNVNNVSEIIERNLVKDLNKEIRDRVKNYVFYDGISPLEVLSEMQKHPKFKRLAF